MVVLILANSEGSDEMQHYGEFYLGFHCLAKYPLEYPEYKDMLCSVLIYYDA